MKHSVPGGGSGAPTIGSPEHLAEPTSLRDWIALLRPRQWVKNIFVLAPLLFSGRLFATDAVASALAAFAIFCLLASGVYAINDVADADGDRSHPTKRYRPVAAHRIRPRAAIGVGLQLWAVAFAAAWLVQPGLLMIAVAYVVLNIAYSFGLKHIVILDVFALATFFILRLFAGAVAVHAIPSIWLLLCGGLLALFLGFAKRRHELHVLGEGPYDHRRVLTEYGEQFLDQISVVLISVTVVSYIMYTVSPEKVAEVGHTLTVSVVFVLYGIFRYLYLIHQRDQGSPTETLLGDWALMVNGVLWATYSGLVIYGPSFDW